MGGRTQPPLGRNSDTIEWLFPNNTTLDAITGVDTTPGAANDPNGASPGMFTNAFFKVIQWGFHQENGAGTLSLDLSAGTLSVAWNQLVAQWADAFFPLGDPNAANECNTDGSGLRYYLERRSDERSNRWWWQYDIRFLVIWQHRSTQYEDKQGGTSEISTGFEGWVAQFELHGAGFVSAVPVPAAFWLFGSGLLGLIGISRRMKTV